MKPYTQRYTDIKEAMSTRRDYVVQKADVVGKQTNNPALRDRAVALFLRGETPTPATKAALKAANAAYRLTKGKPVKNENLNSDKTKRLSEDALQARLQLQVKYTQQVDALILKAMLSLELAYKKIGEGEHLSLTGGETKGVPYTRMNHSGTWPWGVKMQHKKALIRDTLSTLNGNKPYLK